MFPSPHIKGRLGVKVETINRTESVKPMSWGMSALIALMVFLVLAAVALLSGCANVTVIKLAEMCYGAASNGKPTVSFVGESGRVECK